MSDISEILRRRKFGIEEEKVEILPEAKNNEELIVENIVEVDTNTAIEQTTELPIIEDNVLETISQQDQSLSLDVAKDKILSINELNGMIDGIEYFEKQMTYSFFYLAHCFYKIREDRLFEQRGYSNFTDFIKTELKTYSYKNVYNYLSIADTFPLESTPQEVLDLGMTKLVIILSIKEKSKRMKFIQDNINEIKEMSTRELKSKINKMYKVIHVATLTKNFENELVNNITTLKDSTIKFGSFLEKIESTENKEESFVVLKEELKQMEGLIKEMKDKLQLKLQNSKSVGEYTNKLEEKM